MCIRAWIPYIVTINDVQSKALGNNNLLSML